MVQEPKKSKIVKESKNSVKLWVNINRFHINCNNYPILYNIELFFKIKLTC